MFFFVAEFYFCICYIYTPFPWLGLGHLYQILCIMKNNNNNNGGVQLVVPSKVFVVTCGLKVQYTSSFLVQLHVLRCDLATYSYTCACILSVATNPCIMHGKLYSTRVINCVNYNMSTCMCYIS